MTTALFPELTANLADPYTGPFQAMLDQSAEATAQCDRMNVVTAFTLLRGDTSIDVPVDCPFTKEQVLDAAWLAVPTTYQVGDIDPD